MRLAVAARARLDQALSKIAEGHRSRNGLAGQCHVEKQGVELAAGTGKAAALLDEVLGEGCSLRRRHAARRIEPPRHG